MLAPDKLEGYAAAVHAKGAALDNCWDFIDGTVRPICRPQEHQRVFVQRFTALNSNMRSYPKE